MAKDVVGTIRKFTVEGIAFRIAADANVNRRPTNVENTMIPTSGRSMQKKTKMTPEAEGFDILVNAEEIESLKSFAEGLDLVKVSYTTAAGAVYRCTGQIEIESHESETGKAGVRVLPDDDWTAFPD